MVRNLIAVSIMSMLGVVIHPVSVFSSTAVINTKGAQGTSTAKSSIAPKDKDVAVLVKDSPKATTTAKGKLYEELSRAMSKGGKEELIKVFSTLSPEYRGDTDINCVYAALLLSSGDTKGAKDVASKLLDTNPKNKDVLVLNMQIAKANRDKGTKSRIIKQLLALDPNDPSANTELGDELSLQRNYKLASTYYKKALLGDKDNTEALLGVGKAAYFLGKNAEGRAALNRILSKDPNNASAYSYLAKIAAEEDNYKVATDNIKKAIYIDNTVTDYYLDLGNYYRQQGQLSEAQDAWTKAINLEPSYFLGYAYRGGIYDEEGKYDLALKDYRKVLEVNPKYYYAYESIGIVLWHEKRWQEAIDAFTMMTKYSKDNISYPLLVAACYYKEGKRQEAKKALEPMMKDRRNKASTAKSAQDKERYSVEYDMLRLYYDFSNASTENAIAAKVNKITNSNRRGMLTYYLGLYCQLKGAMAGAKDFYAEVLKLNGPMFFEYRLAQWSSEDTNSNE